MEVTPVQKQYVWHIYDQHGHEIKLDNLEYLSYLIEESRVDIQNLNKQQIRSLICDFEEIKEYPFFRMYLFFIDSQINSLKRVLDYELIHNDRPRRAINCELVRILNERPQNNSEDTSGNL